MSSADTASPSSIIRAAPLGPSTFSLIDDRTSGGGPRHPTSVHVVRDHAAVTVRARLTGRPDRTVVLARWDTRPVAYDVGPPIGCGRGRWLTPSGRLRYDIWAEA